MVDVHLELNERSERSSKSPAFPGPDLPPDSEPRVLGGTSGILSSGFGLYPELQPQTNKDANKTEHEIRVVLLFICVRVLI